MCRVDFEYEWGKELEELSLDELDELKSKHAEVRQANKRAMRQIQDVYQAKLIEKRAIEKMSLPKGLQDVTISVPLGKIGASSKPPKVEK